MEEKQRIKKTDCGWVDLSNLVYNGKSVNWDMSIGKVVDFQYDDIISTLTIVGRTDDVQYVYIDVPGYVQHHKIYVGQIRHGQLGSVIKRITADFKYEIGDVVDGLRITNRYRKPGYKYYDYCCMADQYCGTIREDHLVCGHGCPICRNSIGEKRVKEYLIKHKINFVQQHTFDGCKNIRDLPFDFYLPDYNTCIEYDGIQHFEPVDFGGKGEEYAIQQFKDLQIRDGIKNNYCQNNHIFLCRIKYTQNVKTTLDMFFKTLKTQQND
jgi:hypothetical protein